MRPELGADPPSESPPKSGAREAEPAAELVPGNAQAPADPVVGDAVGTAALAEEAGLFEGDGARNSSPASGTVRTGGRSAIDMVTSLEDGALGQGVLVPREWPQPSTNKLRPCHY